MAEETEGSGAGAEASGAGVGRFAAAMALGGASREWADAFLKVQQTLIAKQSRLLDEQFKSIRLTSWKKRAGILLRVATAFVGLVGFVGAMARNAAEMLRCRIYDSFA